MSIEGTMRIEGSLSPAAPETREASRLANSAKDFEGLLIGQMLKHARQSGAGGWLGTGDDQAGATMMEVAEEHLARILASQGAFGLARLVEEGVRAQSVQKDTLTGK